MVPKCAYYSTHVMTVSGSVHARLDPGLRFTEPWGASLVFIKAAAVQIGKPHPAALDKKSDT